ncbi:phage tail protein [Pseudescherichia vulneris]|jgi:hypothetical protein
MTNLKSLLLAPENTARAVTILGADVFIRRITAFEAEAYDEKQAELRADNNSRGIAIEAASFILSALVDENGVPVPAENLPVPDELLKSRSNAALIEAVNVITQHSWGTLEDAKKN